MIFMNAFLKAVNTKNTGVVITTLPAKKNSKQNKTNWSKLEHKVSCLLMSCCDAYTVESWFFKLSGEKELVQIIDRLKKSGVINWREVKYGLNYQKFQETEGSRNTDSPLFTFSAYG